MKNLQFYIMMLIFFGIIGCTTDKENNVSVNEFSNKLDIENATIEEKIAYKTFHLKNITKLIEKY